MKVLSPWDYALNVIETLTAAQIDQLNRTITYMDLLSQFVLNDSDHEKKNLTLKN